MKRILLIDDDEGIRELWKRFHDVAEPVFRGELAMDVANDLARGLIKIEEAKIEKKPYDIVIIDLKFEGQGSDYTMGWIVDYKDKIPPIVVLTGDVDIWVRRKCMMFGAADFWNKDDAQQRPDLFFKSLYNRYLANYPETMKATANG